MKSNPHGSPPPSSGAVLRAGSVIDEWRLIRLVSSEGKMGQIYEVEHTDRKNRAALKLLRSEFATSDIAVQRGQLEAIAGARVNHPNLNVVLAAGHYDGRPFLVTPLLEGQHLRAWLGQLGPLPIADALFVATEVAAGLGALHHQARAIHRDVKPENIFITYGGEVKLLDLGIAKFLENSLGKLRTNSGELTGSIAYMAPEQLEHEPTFGSDLYALGLVLYEMIAGRHPQADPQGQWPAYNILIQRLLHREIPPPLSNAVPSCPKSLADLVTRCLAQSPADRPQSAETLCDLLKQELTRWLAAQKPSVRPVGRIFRRDTPKDATKRRPSRALSVPAYGERSDLHLPKVIVPLMATSSAHPTTARRRRPSRRAALWITLGLALLLVAYALATLKARSPAPPTTHILPNSTSFSPVTPWRATRSRKGILRTAAMLDHGNGAPTLPIAAAPRDPVSTQHAAEETNVRAARATIGKRI